VRQRNGRGLVNHNKLRLAKHTRILRLNVLRRPPKRQTNRVSVCAHVCARVERTVRQCWFIDAVSAPCPAHILSMCHFSICVCACELGKAPCLDGLAVLAEHVDAHDGAVKVSVCRLNHVIVQVLSIAKQVESAKAKLKQRLEVFR
jgi:hypothetical protein